MQNTNDASLPYYAPKYYALLSPTYHQWIRLTAADVHALREWPDACPGTSPNLGPPELLEADELSQPKIHISTSITLST